MSIAARIVHIETFTRVLSHRWGLSRHKGGGLGSRGAIRAPLARAAILMLSLGGLKAAADGAGYKNARRAQPSKEPSVQAPAGRCNALHLEGGGLGVWRNACKVRR